MRISTQLDILGLISSQRPSVGRIGYILNIPQKEIRKYLIDEGILDKESNTYNKDVLESKYNDLAAISCIAKKVF